MTAHFHDADDRSSPDRIRHRSDIDGLRAIAVLAIMGFHAQMSWCLGGYRGVDMFFVISGFLITGILLRELAAGTLSLRRFYERRIRRILPALFVMLLITSGIAYALLLPADIKLFSQNLVAIVVFSSNILFWRRAGGFDFYFEPSAHLNPLLHTWSLGVEEQFYLVFPLLLLAAWHVRRRSVFATIAVVGVASFVFSSLIDGEWHLGLPFWREANFYLLPSRAWQLMLGAAVAVRSQASPAAMIRSRAWREAAAALGLALILYSLTVHRVVDVQFPSVMALPATVGTALILSFGESTVAAALLSVPVIAGIGLISYSAYLWHQPVFAFAHYLALNDELTLSTRVTLILVSLVIAWISWRVVETPFRDRQRVSTRVVIIGAAMAAVVLLAGGLTFSRSRALPVMGRVLASPSLVRTLTMSGVPSAMKTCAFDPSVGKGEPLGCSVNLAFSGAPSFLVLGDSHAAALLPAFHALAGARGQSARAIMLRGCPPLIGIISELETECLAMQPSVLAFAQQQGVAQVFLVARWNGYATGELHGAKQVLVSQHGMPQTRTLETARKSLVDSLRRTVDAYEAAGIAIVIVRQIPQQLHRPLGAYLQALMHRDPMTFLRSVSATVADHERTQESSDQMFSAYVGHPFVRVVDLSTALCREGVCEMGGLEESYYWDDNHLSDAGARIVGAELVRVASHGG